MSLERKRRGIDETARKGHFEKNNTPGVDAFDEAVVDDEGNLRVPSATTGESTSTYDEEGGPVDLRGGGQHHRQHQKDGLSDVGPDGLQNRDDESGDEADKWLREHDPDYKKRGGEE